MIRRIVLMMVFLTLAPNSYGAPLLNNIWQKSDGVLYSSILNEKAEPAMISIILPGSIWASIVISFFGRQPCDPHKNTADIWVDTKLDTVNFTCETFGDLVIFSYTFSESAKANALYQLLRAGESILIDQRFLILPGNIRD